MTPSSSAKRPILVVDDEPEMLQSLRDLLRREFDVHTASSGIEGLAILESREIHVVMTDQRMPQMTGVELLTKVKCEYPAAIRMIFTGYAELRALIEAINQGNVFRYVSKPWDPEELVAALRLAGAAYDQIVERQRLLNDLRTCEAHCVAFHEGLQSGRLGALNPEGLAEVASLVERGRALIQRLDHTLSAKPVTCNGDAAPRR